MKDEGKPKLSLVPKSAIYAGARALTYGETKHGRFSFKEDGFPCTVMADKVLRHIYQYLDGENVDEESGLHPLDHALADLMILVEIVEKHKHQDDRFLSIHKQEQRTHKSIQPSVWGQNEIEAYLLPDPINLSICGKLEGKEGFHYIVYSEKEGKLLLLDQDRARIEYKSLTFDPDSAIIEITND